MKSRLVPMAFAVAIAGLQGSFAQLEPPEGNKIPLSASIEVEITEEKVTAHVGVTIEPNGDGSIYQIGDWGEPRLDGDVIYLDAVANGPLESFNVDPIHEEHAYCLFSRGDGGGGGGHGVGPIEFETLDLVPEFLRPSQREDIVIRSLDEWQKWVDRHWPEDVLGIGPIVPVDFETHTVIGVFLGRVIEGAGVEIHDIESDGETVHVHYAEWTPDSIEGAPLFYHFPGHMVAIPKTKLPVLFNGRPPQGSETRPIEFKPVELVPEWMRPVKPEEVVIRTDEDWGEWAGKHFPPDILAPIPGPPVDLSELTLVGVFLGETDEGIGIDIIAVESNGAVITVTALETLPGVAPEENRRVRPGTMVAIPRTGLPVAFRREVLAFPGPPPIDHPQPKLPELPVAAQEEGEPVGGDWLPRGTFLVVFRVDGFEVAQTKLDLSGDGGKPRGIPARASIDIVQDETSATANVEVAFTGAPYHSIAEWGPVERWGHHFVLNATSTEIVFIRAPDLPYFEKHRFALPLGDHVEPEPPQPQPEPGPGPEPGPEPGEKEPIDFRVVKSDLRTDLERNVVIDTRDEWWDLIGFKPGPLVLPPPDPIDFEEETLIGVFRGAKPNGCYGVGITHVNVHDGVLLVHYQLRDPRKGEFCTQAIVHPSWLVAIAKPKWPVDFIEYPDPGVDPDPIPVEPDEGIGDGADGPPPMALGELYTVEFRINGLTYAHAEFVHGEDDPGGNDRIPARADIKFAEVDGEAAIDALVEVAFTGAPYHMVADWGPVLQRGNDFFVLDAEANEVHFIVEPELPYFEKHRYRIPLSGGVVEPEPDPDPDPIPFPGEPLDFERLKTHLQLVEPHLMAIQTEDDWWKLIGFEPGPLVDPVPPPVDLSENTLIAVFLGERPDTCYGVTIQEVLLHDDVLFAVYRLREPRPDEGCGDALTYPASLVAIPKTALPVEFIELPDDGVDLGGPVPVDGVGGPRVVTVEFRLNGHVLATGHYKFDDVGLPDPDPDPDPDRDPNGETKDPLPTIDLPVGFVDWLGNYVPGMPPESEFAAGGDPDGNIQDDAASLAKMNRDGDRFTDVQEFLLGRNPVDPGDLPTIRPEWIRDDEMGDQFAVGFQRRKGAEEHADFVVEISQDLETWVEHADSVNLLSIRDLAEDLEEVLYSLEAEDEGVGLYRYLRISVREKAVPEE